MGKKLALASLFFTSTGGGASLRSSSPAPSMSSASSWQWPASCTQARTASFRMADDGAYSTSTMNPAYLDEPYTSSCRLSSSASSSSPAPVAAEEEAVIRGLRDSSSRLFFEPEPTSSILKKPNSDPANTAMAFGGATAMAIDSADPYGDFRRSMEEMVLSHGGAGGGGDDWGWLEEMLGWYLRANGKKTHGLIVGAFVDLLVALTSSSSPASSSSSSSSSSSGFLNCKQSIIQS